MSLKCWGRKSIKIKSINESPVKTLEFDNSNLVNELFGPQNQNLALIAGCTGASLESRGNALLLRAKNQEELEKVSDLVAQLYSLLKSGQTLGPEDITSACTILAQKPDADLSFIRGKAMQMPNLRRNIVARTLNQQTYLNALQENEMVFAIGPAGTGKTYLAVAAAVSALLAKKIKRIILTRPAVEAGEKLGYLPGDLAEKVNPYLRPLYDALHDMLDQAKVAEMMETGIIEVAPLAFMRGRTLNNAFIILDEAQNTTPEQMKMFLTRLGSCSRAVITGDITQIDLPQTYNRPNSFSNSFNGKEKHLASPHHALENSGAERSGLVQASKILNNVPGICFISFNETDVVRHPLVARIVSAYECYEKKC